MRVDEFDFDLPESLIALRPARPRDAARLLVVRGPDGVIEHKRVHDLPDLLRAGDVMVVNDTRVIPAALEAVRPAREDGGGGDVRVELNLHKRLAPNAWRAFARPAKRLRVADTLAFNADLSARVEAKGDGGEVDIAFSQSGGALDDAIAQIGAPPLPSYIARKRDVDDADADDYQTTFAKEPGSVAAPTAGLHFTPDLLDKLARNGVGLERTTLHVGAGTFLPVKSDRLEDHVMHSEWCVLRPETAQSILDVRDAGGRCVAVGTTALRTLESAARATGQLAAFEGETDIFITPGYHFNAVDALMTNFHLPRSTLFMLVCALMGVETMQRAYEEAIDEGYRFYSYGDACLLLPHG
ncbi:MAG: tRNA preQ1(34) S-adenosylmethionine ribosyltransferase-isomerase QueA [Pseudomonadota bacterium]